MSTEALTEASVLKELCLNEGESPLYSYKRLYHRTVLRCGQLERQIERFSKLFEKLAKLERLNEDSLCSVAENHSLLDEQRKEVLAERHQWMEKLKDAETQEQTLREDLRLLTVSHADLEGELDGLRAHCGRHLAGWAVSQASLRALEQQHKAAETTLMERNTTLAKLKRKLSSYNRHVKRMRDLQESLEFSEAERTTLSEYTTELEQQMAKLKPDQQTAVGQGEELQLMKTTLGETCAVFDRLLHRISGNSRTAAATADAAIPSTTQHQTDHSDGPLDTSSLLARLKTLTHDIDSVLFTATTQPPTHSQDNTSQPTSTSDDSDSRRTILQLPPPPPPTSCPQCVQLHEQLSTAITALNGGGSAIYADLLQENFSLRQEAATARRELSYGRKQFEMLTSYLHEYQSNSTKKISILKENLGKADKEISELDKLVEQTRILLHANLAHVRSCPPLLELLRELDGTDAPPCY